MPTTDLFRRTPFAAAMRVLPLTCLDVGARGGIEADLLPLAFACDVVGFEPDAEELRRLSAGPPGPLRSRRYLPVALAGSAGRRTLHLTADRASSTLLTPDGRIGARFGKPQFFAVERTIEVETATLDEAVAVHLPRPPDYLKIDVEGAEGEIFAGGTAALDSVIAIKTEIAYLPFRIGQPLAADIDRLLRGYGFELMDLGQPAHWRRHGYVIDPLSSGGAVPYARGQIMHGDALYIRGPDALPAGEDGSDVVAADRLLRASWLLMGHGFFDHAEALLQRPAARRRLSEDFAIDPIAALREAARAFGRIVWRRALARHLRQIVPFLRHAARALR